VSKFNVVGSQESCTPRGPSPILIFDDALDFKDAAIIEYAPGNIKLVIDIFRKRSRLAALQLRAFEGKFFLDRIVHIVTWLDGPWLDGQCNLMPFKDSARFSNVDHSVMDSNGLIIGKVHQPDAQLGAVGGVEFIPS
jgi:hypothetical protein